MFNQDERKKMMMAGVVIAFSLIVYHILNNFTASRAFIQRLFQIISPITVAFVMFYMINIPMKAIENKVFKKLKLPKKIKRVMALLTTLIIFILLFTLFFVFAGPQLVRRVGILINLTPSYAAAAGNFINDQFSRLNVSNDIISQAETMWANFIGGFASMMMGVVDSASSIVSGFISGVFTGIISTVLAIYILLDKEHLASIIERLWQAYAPKKLKEPFISYVGIMNRAFEQFVRGQLVEALILGVICYIGMLIFGFEYPLLISFLIGLTNIIPLFGPYIGAVPSLLLLLVVNPVQALWFLVYVIVLQQIESNLIYPKVVGDAMGISGFWIMVAVIVGNSLFGIAGILIGIPLLSSVYAIVREATNKKLEEKTT